MESRNLKEINEMKNEWIFDENEKRSSLKSSFKEQPLSAHKSQKDQPMSARNKKNY